MKLLCIPAFWLFLAATLVCGCGEKTPQAPPIDNKVFETAAPETKEMWDVANAASEKNDPAGAITILRTLSRQPLSQEQLKTVAGAMAANQTKLRAKAKAGDAEAAKAMETLGISAEQK